jgi:hypothetical protein
MPGAGIRLPSGCVCARRMGLVVSVCRVCGVSGPIAAAEGRPMGPALPLSHAVAARRDPSEGCGCRAPGIRSPSGRVRTADGSGVVAQPRGCGVAGPIGTGGCGAAGIHSPSGCAGAADGSGAVGLCRGCDVSGPIAAAEGGQMGPVLPLSHAVTACRDPSGRGDAGAPASTPHLGVRARPMGPVLSGPQSVATTRAPRRRTALTEGALGVASPGDCTSRDRLEIARRDRGHPFDVALRERAVRAGTGEAASDSRTASCA